MTLKSTNGANSATILIADRRGREEILRALNGLPSRLRTRLASSLAPKTETSLPPSSKVVAPVAQFLRRNWIQILLPTAAGFGIWEVDVPAGTATVSEGFATMIGLTTTTRRISLALLEAMIYPADQAVLRSAVDRAIETGDFQAEFRIVLPRAAAAVAKSGGNV